MTYTVAANDGHN